MLVDMLVVVALGFRLVVMLIVLSSYDSSSC